MADVNISKFRASVVREGSRPATPGFVVSEGQSPTDPAGSGQNHLPVTIAPAATALAITESQILSGAGTVAQYIRGDGSLADFPEASGGGSSISYYLNGSVNQGTIGGVAYKELNKVPILGAGTDFSISADGYIASFLTDAGDPNLLEIPGGNWNFETYFSSSSSGGTPTFYVELYKYDGTTFTLIASNSSAPEFIAFGTTLTAYFSTLAVPTTTLALTDRLAVRYYVTHSGRTITMHTENNHLCQIITTFTTGLTALNGLTAQVQSFAVGTSGTDFNIASATATHTFNLPTASATNRGALSSADWSTFNGKQNALTLTTTGSSGAATLVGSTLNIPNYSPDLSGYVPTSRTITINGTTQDLSANRTFNVGTVTSVGLSSATSGVTIGSTPVTTSGTITLAIATASGSQNGLLSSTDWTTFNNKQNALTNPVTGTGTTNYLPKFTGTSTIGNSIVQEGGAGIFINGVDNFIPTNGGWFFNGSGNYASGIFASSSSNNLTLRSPQKILFQIGFSTEAMTLSSSGNLLVGTTTDNGARLQVSGNSYISGDLRFGTDYAGSNTAIIKWQNGSASIPNSLGLFTWGDAKDIQIGGNNVYFRTEAGVNRMIITSSGNVGIGTTTPSTALHVVSNDNSANRTSPYNVATITATSANAPYNGFGTGLVFAATHYNGLVYNGARIRTVLNDNSIVSLGNAIAFDVTPTRGGALTEAMKIDYNGNVGIGTTSPIYKLVVSNSGATGLEIDPGTIISNRNLLINYNRSTGSYSQIQIDASLTILGNQGNLLVGTTTDTGERLQVSGNIRTNSGYIQIRNSSNPSLYINNGSAQWQQFVNSGNHLVFSDAINNVLTLGYNGGSSYFQGGNVGIGTTSPSNGRLEVLTSSAVSYNPAGFNVVNLALRSGSGTTTGSIVGLTMGLGGSAETMIGAVQTASGTADIVFQSFNGSAYGERMRITSGGNVLIGTTTDNGAKLNVNGTIRTANPTGSTSDGWLLGRALVSGTSTPDRWIRVQIGNLYYDILAVYMGSV